MATVTIEEYDDRVVEVEVSPEVAAVLSAPERGQPLHEISVTDLAGRRRRGDDAERLARIDWLSKALRDHYRRRRLLPEVSSWQGPKGGISLLLGLSRIWEGEPFARGVCAICRGAPLPPEAACLGCCRTGLDATGAIPTPSREERRLCERAERIRLGRVERLRGGRA